MEGKCRSECKWILLKKLVEDVIGGNRESLTVPVGFRHRMLQLVYDQLGHVGTGKMFEEAVYLARDEWNC